MPPRVAWSSSPWRAGSEGAVHSHVRQAVKNGATADELRQVAILAITTLGFPAAMAAFSSINDILDEIEPAAS